MKKVTSNAPTMTVTNKYGEVMQLEDMISEQDAWIYETKKQLTLIEHKSTAMGTMQFDLPAHIRKSTREDKPRKDNYTCMLIAYTSSKYYFDMLFTEIDQVQSTFTPFAI